MGMRRVIVAGAVAFGSAATVMGAGSASAVQVWSDPGYVGISFDHNETAFLANTPVPDWIDQWSTPRRQFVDPAAYSTRPAYEGSDGTWYSGYSFAELWREAAAQPQGSVGLWLTDPAKYEYMVQLRQY